MYVYIDAAIKMLWASMKGSVVKGMALHCHLTESKTRNPSHTRCPYTCPARERATV